MINFEYNVNNLSHFLSGNNKKKDNEGTRVDYLIKKKLFYKNMIMTCVSI